tara:strand:- start:154 stop:786 length:633 start_codon:yes stop_codon:yes gene_type:complete
MTSDVERRRQAIAAGHSGDLELAKSFLTDPKAKVRSAAISSLQKLGKLSDQILKNALIDQSAEVRIRAIELATKSSTEIPIFLLQDQEHSVVETACWALGEKKDVGKTAIKELIKITNSHEDQLSREAAVAALGSIGDFDGLDAILSALKDRPAIRRRATIALAAFDDPRVEDALKESLRDRDWQVRQAAEDLLDNRKDENFIEIRSNKK